MLLPNWWSRGWAEQESEDRRKHTIPGQVTFVECTLLNENWGSGRMEGLRQATMARLMAILAVLLPGSQAPKSAQ